MGNADERDRPGEPRPNGGEEGIVFPDQPHPREYRVIRVLGRGSFGEVSMARHTMTGRVVALKRIFIHSMESGLPENVVREVKCMQALDHPNVCALLDVFPQGGSLMQVLEYCGTDLSRVVEVATWRFSEDIIKGIALQLLKGVAAMHDAGILHRDLKPGNVLLNEDGIVKIADFGLARLNNGGARPQYTHTVATRWYRAPELLFSARSYGTGVDMWAVGCVIAELIGLAPLVAGESDIDQLGRVLKTFGSIDEADWPEVHDLPDYAKISFPATTAVPFEELLPDASSGAISLISQLLVYNPKHRLGASEAQLHDWFFSHPLPCTAPALAELARLTCAAPTDV